MQHCLLNIKQLVNLKPPEIIFPVPKTVGHEIIEEIALKQAFCISGSEMEGCNLKLISISIKL